MKSKFSSVILSKVKLGGIVASALLLMTATTAMAASQNETLPYLGQKITFLDQSNSYSLWYGPLGEVMDDLIVDGLVTGATDDLGGQPLGAALSDGLGPNQCIALLDDNPTLAQLTGEEFFYPCDTPVSKMPQLLEQNRKLLTPVTLTPMKLHIVSLSSSS